MNDAIFWDVTLCFALVRTDVSEERSTSIIRVTGISELGTRLAVTSNRRSVSHSFQFTYSCHPDDGDATFLRNIVCVDFHCRTSLENV
jgi:hypothetical protein